MSDVVSFISAAGGSVVSKKYIDTEEYLSDADNMSICDFNTIANIEPAILTIYNCKVGTDLELVDENGKKYLLDSSTGKKLKV